MQIVRIASKHHRQRSADGACFVQIESARGFSLIELLVVISIIGILTTIVLASLSQARMRGRDARRIADIRQIQLALELYYDANGQYPLALSSLSGPGYIPAVPKDPANGDDYAYVALQGAGVNGQCASYHLGARLEVFMAGTGSPFNDDNDATVGGTYGTGSGDGPICSGSAWSGTGSADPNYIPASAGDFNGGPDSASLPVYDMRP